MTLEINEKHRLEEELKEKDSDIAALKNCLNGTTADKQRLEEELQAMKEEITKLKEKPEEDKSLKESSFESATSSQENVKPKPTRKKATKKAKSTKQKFDDDEIELLKSVTKKNLSNNVSTADGDMCLGFSSSTYVSILFINFSLHVILYYITIFL